MEFFEYKNEKIMFPGKMIKFYVLMGTICNRDMNPRPLTQGQGSNHAISEIR